MNHRFSYTVLLIFVSTLLCTSCLVTKKYEQPKVSTNKLYRVENGAATDTSNMSNIAWNKLFTDTILQRHIQHALDSNLDMQIAIQNIYASQATLKQAKAAFSPVVSAGPSVSYTTQSVNTQLGQISGVRRQMYQYEISADISWEADVWGKINSRKKAALANYLGTEEARRMIRSQLVAIVADNYFQLLALDEQKSILTLSISSLEKSLETNKALKDAGTVTEVAVKQNQAQVLNAKARLVSIDNQIRILENSTSIILGEAPQKIERTTLVAQLINTPLAYGVPYQLLSNRPDVLIAEYDLMNAFELTNAAKANFYPSLSISASGGLQSIDFDKLFSVQSLFASVIGSLTQPLWNQRQIRSQYENSLAQQQKAYLNYKKAILTAGQEVSNALYDFKTQNELLNIKQEEYRVLDTAATYSQDLLTYGMANYLDVLTAQQNSLNAKLDYINASYGRLSAMVELYRALGGGR